MIAVVDQQFRLLDNLSKALNDSSNLLTYNVNDKILHEFESKEYKYQITDIIHKTGRRNGSSIVIVVKTLKNLWKVK